MNVEDERKIFWQKFEDILNENGNPFDITYIMGGSIRHWAVVNRNNAWNAKALEAMFLKNKRIIQVDIYIQDDLFCFNRLYPHVKELQDSVKVPIECVAGERNGNTRRIKCEFPFAYGYKCDYDRVIEEILPVMIKFKEFLDKYTSYEFFDY